MVNVASKAIYANEPYQKLARNGRLQRWHWGNVCGMLLLCCGLILWNFVASLPSYNTVEPGEQVGGSAIYHIHAKGHPGEASLAQPVFNKVCTSVVCTSASCTLHAYQ